MSRDKRSMKQPNTITILCDRSEKKNVLVHFRMALVLTSEMVSQGIISPLSREIKMKVSLACRTLIDERTKQAWRCESRGVPKELLFADWVE